MDVKVLFFARSRELAGTPETSVSLPAGATTGALLRQLLEQYPGLKEIEGRFVLSLNQEYLELGQDAALRPGDEVAIIPPISGG